MMMERYKPKTHHSKIEDDILFHFEEIAIDLSRIKLDYNRDNGLVYKMNSILSKLNLIIELHSQLDKPIFKALKIKVNKMISENPQLKGIILHIENSRCKDSVGKIETFKIII